MSLPRVVHLVVPVANLGGVEAVAGTLDVELVVACDGSEEAARSIEAPEIASDYRKVVSRDDIDAIVIATPNKFHKEIALAAFDAGKHVLCEKPLALNATEAREMYDLEGLWADAPRVDWHDVLGIDKNRGL